MVLGIFLPYKVYKWVGNCHRPMHPNWKVFGGGGGKFALKKQAKLSVFVEKWYSEGLENCIFLGKEKLKSQKCKVCIAHTSPT